MFQKTFLKEINNKVKNYPWHEMPKDGGWNYGTNLDYMKEISNYWVTKFNWKKHEEEINKFSNFKTDVDGFEIHFIQEKGSGSNPHTITYYTRLAWINNRVATYNRKTSTSRKIWWKRGRCF